MGAEQHPRSLKPRILLALQFWEGDRERAGELARLITDLEPVKRDDADLLLSARFDTTPDPEVMAYAGRRFNVYSNIGRTRLTGHPAGSFGLWHDTVVAVRDRCAAGEMPRYSCVLTFEADCVPVRRRWIEGLLDYWERHAKGGIAIGCEWLRPACPWPHINGNLLVSGDPRRLDELAGWRGNPSRPWDVEIYPFLKSRGARGAPVVRSFDVTQGTVQLLRLLNVEGAHLFHGDKGGTLHAVVRSHLLGKPEPAAPKADSDLFKYPDIVPSLASQVPGMRRIRIPGAPLRRFNPGLVATPSGWFLAYRAIRTYDADSSIFIARLDREFRFVSEVKVTGLRTWPDPDVASYYEDPRLLWHDGELLMAYEHSAYFPDTIWQQALCCVSPDTGVVVRDYPLGFRTNTGKPKHFEKNWQFFSTSRGLHFAYEILPHVLIRTSDGVEASSQHVPGAAQWEARYGMPRGGTPPVLVGPGRYLSFFHSWRPHKERKRRYYWGAYEFLFDVDSLRTKVTRCTQHPIATASARDGFLWPQGSCHWEPIVVFPTGAHRSDDGVWTVAAGVNDSFLATFQFRDDFVNAAFDRRDPPRYEERGEVSEVPPSDAAR